ncbi:PIG-L family deacetylase [Cellulosimicrobium terreum]|nr:PIG-L family deacetylase [Cellulosimicrobium terreum]
MPVGPTEQAVVVPDGGLLVVHAHPDDETLATGALLATWAAAGEPVTVVTCTRGERGEVIDTPAHPTGVGHLEGDGPALAAHRERELAAALDALGVRDHVFLDAVRVPTEAVSRGAQVPDAGWPARVVDSGMAWAAPGIARADAEAALEPGAFVGVDLDEAARRLAAVVRDRRPAVVVTYEPGGGYGHPDHVRAHDVTVRALALVRAAGGPVPRRWAVVMPADVLRAARRELGRVDAVRESLRETLDLPDPDEELPPVAQPADVLRGVQVVAVAPVRDAVLGALRAHATQVQAVGAAHPSGSTDSGDPGGAVDTVLAGWYALSNDVLAPIVRYEYYLPADSR